MITALLLLALGCAAPAARAAGAFEAAISTATPPSPLTIYTAESLRDPFLPFSSAGAGAGAGVSKPFNLEDFNIHNLTLRGTMKDSAADYALFSDSSLGTTFILRRGKLYDSKNKIVPGVTGKLKVRQKWAQLETSDHDVQTFRLGDEEKE